MGLTWAFAALVAISDSAPKITLAQALDRATRLDPNYVSALGQMANATWARRAARSTFVLPSLTVSSDFQTYSTEIFNVGTGQRARTISVFQANARYDIFTGGRKLAELSRANAALEGARATELQARFDNAFATESDFYAVLSGRELRDVAADRLKRAEEQMVLARARVVSGAVVQTDSLQILLEMNRARVALLRQEAQLTVSRLQLGRRVGIGGPVDAQHTDTTPAAELPVTLPQAIQLALEQGPEYRIARANEAATGAVVKFRRAAYLPQLSVAGNYTRFGDQFVWPAGLNRSSLTLSFSFPLWDNLQRELNVSRARVDRDFARAAREDLERAAEADVTEAYQAYETARVETSYAIQAVAVAQENYRVQQARYRAGASTILDLLDSQSQLTEAQAELVQVRYATRLALAGLEVILGRRFHEPKD
jgi:outer membrane protein TolC